MVCFTGYFRSRIKFAYDSAGNISVVDIRVLVVLMKRLRYNINRVIYLFVNDFISYKKEEGREH